MTVEEGDRVEDEDGSENPDESGRPRDYMGPSAPLECGEEKTGNSGFLFGDEESRLRGAERYYPPRFRRSVAESGVGGHELGRTNARERVRGSKGQEIKAAQQEQDLRKERENEVQILQGQYKRGIIENPETTTREQKGEGKP
ncbi:hypothetical protein NDU88_010416 [Pleurodeles waltl]|uniref:Uncharacterized protein n=1 Tax=Pleurodeles waltl TaxID=8319 RepID=A0AAV7QWE6_PLEWA|nr:hypothetical protein NDU88_010416 [Pleurodeles waltl]